MLGAPRTWLAMVLVGYVALATGYAVGTPPFNTPDEPAHYNYIAHVASTGQLPVLQVGDWDLPALERLKASRFPPESSVEAIRYESHQPPLYYLLMVPVYRATDGMARDDRVVVLRLASVVFGSLVVLAVYRAGALAFPSMGWLPPMAAGIAAFIPMHTANTATVNNDTLAELLASVTLLTLLTGLRRGFGDRHALILGALFGLLLLTKVTTYAFVPLGLGIMALSSDGWRTAGRRVGIAILVAGLVSAWWFVRNMLVYGPEDPIAARRHDLVVFDQPRWAQPLPEAAGAFLTTLFHSFWGQFGWMGIPLDERTYVVLAMWTVLPIAGLTLALVHMAGGEASKRSELVALAVLAAATAAVFAEVVYYNLTFIQPQGRYLFPAILSIAILMALGWCRLAEAHHFPALRMAPLMSLLPLVWAALAMAEAISRWSPSRMLVAVVLLLLLGVALAVWRRSPDRAATGCMGMVAALFVLDATLLLRVVVPYFKS